MSEPRPEAVAIILTVVGAVRAPFPPSVLEALLRRVEADLAELLPDFLPARPPVTITVADVRDDWIRRDR